MNVSLIDRLVASSKSLSTLVHADQVDRGDQDDHGDQVDHGEQDDVESFVQASFNFAS